MSWWKRLLGQGDSNGDAASPVALELVPLEGFGELRLGRTPEQIAASFGPPSNERGSEKWFVGGAAKVDFRGGRAVFIEINDESAIVPMFDGLELLAATEHAVAAKLDGLDSPVVTGFARTYPHLRVVFWRKDDPEDIREELDAEDDPEYRATLEQELAVAERYRTVAVFAEGYYDDPT